jgi:hypothetical protein
MKTQSLLILEMFDRYGAYSLAVQVLLPDDVRWLDYATIQSTDDVEYAARLVLHEPFKFRIIHVGLQRVLY